MGIFKKISKKIIVYIAVIIILFFILMFLTSAILIGSSVREECKIAQEKYGGECVEALIKLVDDSSTQYGKNRAVWALGQLGDERGLPILEKYYTGESDFKGGKWDEGISQYELSKAIKLLKGGLNISAFVWRN